MTTRYTAKKLYAELEEINTRNAEWGDWRRFSANGEDGMVRVRIATQSMLEKHCALKVIGGGTPRDCINAVYKEMAQKQGREPK